MPYSRPQLDVIIPGLFTLLNNPVQLSSLPGIGQLTRFATRKPALDNNWESHLIKCLNSEFSHLPYAEALINKPNSMLCRPVHLRADVNSAVLLPIPIEDNHLNIINDLNAFFKVDLHIKVLPHNQFVITLDHIPVPIGLPHYLRVTGQKVGAQIQLMKENLDWYKLFNEIQMFLHQHPLNQSTEIGQLTFNSLWCWGGGQSQKLDIDSDWFTDDPLIKAVGKHMGVGCHSLSEVGAADFTRGVVVDLNLAEILKGYADGEPEAYIGLFDQQISHLMENKKIPIRLWGDAADYFEYRPWMKYRFWKSQYEYTG